MIKAKNEDRERLCLVNVSPSAGLVALTVDPRARVEWSSTVGFGASN